MNKLEKIVVTGASGFLGRHLVARLRNDPGYAVYALSSRPDALKGKLGGGNVVYLHKDAVTGEHAEELLSGTILVHCAYPRNATGTEIADGLKYIQSVFESGVAQGAAAIINVSSQSVYSQQRTEMATEETPVCLDSPYAVGKYAVELMLESICRGSRTTYTNLRMASLIGPGFDQRIVNRLVRQMLNREPVAIVRQEKQMGFLDVEDAVSAICAVMNASLPSWKPVYNVGNGRGYTVEQIYSAIAELLRDRLEIQEPTMTEGRDKFSSAVSFARLHADTGFVPEIRLHESIERIIAEL